MIFWKYGILSLFEHEQGSILNTHNNTIYNVKCAEVDNKIGSCVRKSKLYNICSIDNRQINRQIINYWFNFFRNEINLCYFCKRKKSLAEACLNRHCSFKTSWSMWSQDSSQRCKRVGERKTCSERGREGPSLPCAGLKKRWLL